MRKLNTLQEVDNERYDPDVVAFIRKKMRKTLCARCKFEYAEEGKPIVYVITDQGIVWWHKSYKISKDWLLTKHNNCFYLKG